MDCAENLAGFEQRFQHAWRVAKGLASQLLDGVPLITQEKQDNFESFPLGKCLLCHGF